MLRHSCGYKLANDGHDTRAIQHYLGHRSIASTVRYTALAPDRFKAFWKDWGRFWGDLKAHHLAHQTFTDPDVLDQAIHRAVAALNSERKRDPLGNQRISA
jgi:Phage integrase family